jgi:hypothetical protein
MRTQATSLPLHAKQKELKKQLNWQCGRLPRKPRVAKANLLLIQWFTRTVPAPGAGLGPVAVWDWG